MKRFLAILMALLAVTFIFASCGNNGDADTNPDTQQTTDHNTKFRTGNELFKGITSTDLEGKEVDDSVFKGKKLTMVNIWGTFCSPCIGEMPDLQTLSEEYADKGLQIVGIVCDVLDSEDTETIDMAKSIVADTGVKYQNLLPSDSLKTAILDSIISVPATIFLDEEGKQIGQNYIGSRSLDGWKAVVDSILADME